MRDKFDMQRFKRGEAAIWDSPEFEDDKIKGRVDTFVAMDGDRIIVKYWENDDDLRYDYTFIENMESYCTMKPTEGWIMLHPLEKIYWSKADAEYDQSADGMELCKVVKIIEE
jgi:hypothetical protein